MYKIAHRLSDNLVDELHEGLGDLADQYIGELEESLTQGIPGGPKSKSGTLAQSFSAEVKKTDDGVAAVISTDCAYAAALEFGTQTCAPKPFLEPSFRQQKDRFMTHLKACLQKALKESTHGV